MICSTNILSYTRVCMLFVSKTSINRNNRLSSIRLQIIAQNMMLYFVTEPNDDLPYKQLNLNAVLYTSKTSYKRYLK